MKKLALLLLAMVLLISPALALKGEGYPAYDGTPTENSLGGRFGEESLTLLFDPSGDYSYLRDGYIQGCFFTFDKAEEYYLELYLLLPEKIQAGDVLTPESCFRAKADSSSITLFEVDEDNNEQAWFAGQLLGSAYPENSSFSITIADAQYTDESVLVRGSIDAVLSPLQEDPAAGESMALKADFNFTLPLSNAPSADAEESPAPKAAKPAPAFTLPPDYISL